MTTLPAGIRPGSSDHVLLIETRLEAVEAKIGIGVVGNSTTAQAVEALNADIATGVIDVERDAGMLSAAGKRLWAWLGKIPGAVKRFLAALAARLKAEAATVKAWLATPSGKWALIGLGAGGCFVLGWASERFGLPVYHVAVALRVSAWPW